MLVLNVATYFSLALGNNHMQILQVFLRDSFLHYGTLKLEENIPNIWRDCQQLERLQDANGPSALVNQAAGGLYLALQAHIQNRRIRRTETNEQILAQVPSVQHDHFCGQFWLEGVEQKAGNGPSPKPPLHTPSAGPLGTHCFVFKLGVKQRK